MASILKEMVKANLIDKLGEDDSRLNKMAAAASHLADEFGANPQLLIPAILAALDPALPASDPMYAKSKSSLEAEWVTMSSVHPDDPVMWFRAILLEACELVGKGNNAAILWLTAADTLPLARLGKEEAVISKMLGELFKETEKLATESNRQRRNIDPADIAEELQLEAGEPFLVARDQFHKKIGAAFGPDSSPNNHGYSPANQYQSSQNQHWAAEAANYLHIAIADQLDHLAEEVTESQQAAHEKLLLALQSFQTKFEEEREGSRNTLTTDQLRLNTLWWQEALYSPTLYKSYRELKPELASVVMAIDLLTFCDNLTPASLAYVLAEAVARLPNAGYQDERPLTELLQQLHSNRTTLSEAWLALPAPIAKHGRLSLRDLAICMLQEDEANITTLLTRAGLPSDVKIGLPQFARAVFRQEQALRLCKEVTK